MSSNLIWFSYRNKLFPLVTLDKETNQDFIWYLNNLLHIYIHFRVFALHIHALLYFILRTMCEAGRNKCSYYSQYFFRRNNYEPPQNVNDLFRVPEEQVPMAVLVFSPVCLFWIPCSPHSSRPQDLYLCGISTKSRSKGARKAGNRATQILTALVSLLRWAAWCCKHLLMTCSPQAGSYSYWNKVEGSQKRNWRSQSTQPGDA